MLKEISGKYNDRNAGQNRYVGDIYRERKKERERKSGDRQTRRECL